MFYFCNIIIAFYNLLLYGIFRSGIYDYLRLSKMSKSNIRKHRKGFKNYWLYYSINQQRSLGILYGLNYIFLVATVIFTIFAVSLGFIKALQPILLFLSVILCIIEIPSSITASIHSDNAEYGKPFVLLVKRKDTRGYHSSLFGMCSWIITAIFICFSYHQL